MNFRNKRNDFNVKHFKTSIMGLQSDKFDFAWLKHSEHQKTKEKKRKQRERWRVSQNTVLVCDVNQTFKRNLDTHWMQLRIFFCFSQIDWQNVMKYAIKVLSQNRLWNLSRTLGGIPIRHSYLNLVKVALKRCSNSWKNFQNSEF